MLDIEITEAPTEIGTDVVSLAEMKRHLGISPTITAHDVLIQEMIEDTVDKLHGMRGELNSTLLPTTYKRYLWKFPGDDESGNPLPIQIPFGPLISVLAVTTEDGSSPDNTMDTGDYTVRSGMIVPEIHPNDIWPTVTSAPRAVSVTFRCGYTTYPPRLKRLVKIMTAHFFENREATVLEPNKTLIDRKVLYANEALVASLRIPLAHDDWNE